jgi:hypothetical protein
LLRTDHPPRRLVTNQPCFALVGGTPNVLDNESCAAYQPYVFALQTPGEPALSISA